MTPEQTERSIEDLAREYLRAIEDHEARKEELLADWAEEYYRPGYLDDEEWQRVKDLLDVDDVEHAEMQIRIAIYRKVATELDREDEFDDEWPAKGGGRVD